MNCVESRPPARAFLAGNEGDAGLPSASLHCFLCVSIICLHLVLFCFFFFLFHPPSLYLLSLLCHSCRAITGIHASTASIRQHDHVSEEGTLRGHGFCRGWTRWHHRSQWRRGGVWLCLYLCVTLSGKQTLASCFSPMNLCSSS